MAEDVTGGFSIVYVTAGSRDEALRIGRSLVESRLVACANVVDGATSLYWWEGAVQEAAEAVLIAKTRTALAEKVVVAVQAAHSYTCPCVVCVPLLGGNPDFLAWIAAETAGAG